MVWAIFCRESSKISSDGLLSGSIMAPSLPRERHLPSRWFVKRNSVSRARLRCQAQPQNSQAVLAAEASGAAFGYGSAFIATLDSEMALQQFRLNRKRRWRAVEHHRAFRQQHHAIRDS